MDNLRARFPDDRLLKAASVLDITNWLQNEDEKFLFGDCDLAFLARTLNVRTARLVRPNSLVYRPNTNYEVQAVQLHIHCQSQSQPLAYFVNLFAVVRLRDPPVP